MRKWGEAGGLPLVMLPLLAQLAEGLGSCFSEKGTGLPLSIGGPPTW